MRRSKLIECCTLANMLGHSNCALLFLFFKEDTSVWSYLFFLGTKFFPFNDKDTGLSMKYSSFLFN